jgi:DNA-binding XRE family transcriptional regulator/ribosomal protein L25 (general stress protein Ctc)
MQLLAADGQDTPPPSMQLKGSVRRLYAYSHLAKDIVVNKNTLVSYEKGKVLNHIEYIFERNGLLLAENKFDDKDVISYSYIYTYENDKLVDVTRAYAGKFQIQRTEYRYDKTGKKYQAIVYDNKDSLQNTIVYKYDTLDNLVEKKTYNTLNWVTIDTRYQYDDRGNCIFVDNLKTGTYNNKPYQEVRRFDDRNNLIYQSFTRQDSLKWEYIARYNGKDSLIYEEVKDGDGEMLSYSELKYNKRNKRILLRQYKQDEKILERETHYKYDKNGNLYQETLYEAKSKTPLLTQTYFYDDKGNWIYCLEKDIKTEMIIVHSRRIIYY